MFKEDITLKHRFYDMSLKDQIKHHLILILFVLAFNLFILFICICFQIYFPAVLAGTLSISLIAPFFDTPHLKKAGKLIYYSPLFLAEKEKDGYVIIHGGTLFDYVYVLNRNLSGRQRVNYIMQCYLRGILKMIEEYDRARCCSLKFKGTSFIINSRTAEKLGFKETETDVLQKCVLVFNYFSLTISYSIANAKLSFPKIGRIKTFETDLNALIKNKQKILFLLHKLEGNYYRS